MPPRLALLLFVSGAALAPAVARAQVYSASMLYGLGSDDMAAIASEATVLLSGGVKGDKRAWKGPSGRQGTLTLIEGGAKAGKTTGRIKLDEHKKDKDWTLTTLNFSKDAKGRWRRAA